jgi:hypothetical protein
MALASITAAQDTADKGDSDSADEAARLLSWPPPDSILLESDKPDEEAAGEDAEDEDSPDGSLLAEKEDIPPSVPRGHVESEKKAPLPASGRMVIDRRCRLVRDTETQWVLIEFADEPGKAKEPARWALPNRMLERLEDYAARSPEVMFRVSGENTTHGGRPFLLVRKATVVDESAAKREPKPSDDELEPPADETDDSADDDDETAPSSDDVIDKLFEDSPGEPVLPRTRKAYEDREQSPSEAPGDDKSVIHPGRGHMVVDRLVTILPVGEGNWLEAVFASDNTGQEPPIRLLPCAALPAAPNRDPDDGSSLMTSIRKYIVSGEITQYRGRRYLLLRKVLAKRDLGEF